MENKYLAGALAVVLILAAVLGFTVSKSLNFAEKSMEQNSKLGATLGPAAALSNKNLLNGLHDLAFDTSNVRRPLSGLVVSSSSVSWGTLDTSDAVSSTVVLVSGAGTIGDLCLTQPTAAASSSVTFRCEITATGSTNASATIYAIAASSSAAVGTLTMRTWVLPVSTFVAPAALSVSTSTTAGQ